jgi:hypothetical protein
MRARRASAVRITRRYGVSDPAAQDETAMKPGDAWKPDRVDTRAAAVEDTDALVICARAGSAPTGAGGSARMPRRRRSPIPLSVDLTATCMTVLFGASIFMKCKRLHLDRANPITGLVTQSIGSVPSQPRGSHRALIHFGSRRAPCGPSRGQRRARSDRRMGRVILRSPLASIEPCRTWIR